MFAACGSKMIVVQADATVVGMKAAAQHDAFLMCGMAVAGQTRARCQFEQRGT
jgi:hypothetical protein